MGFDELARVRHGDRVRVFIRRENGEEKPEVFHVQDVRKNGAARVLKLTTDAIGVEDAWRLDVYPDFDFGKPQMRRGPHRQRVERAEVL